MRRVVASPNNLNKIAVHLLIILITPTLYSCASMENENGKTDNKLISSSEKAGYKIKIKNWDHHWNCADIGGNCWTSFSGTAEVVRADGTPITWNLVESWTSKDCGASPQNYSFNHLAHDTKLLNFGYDKSQDSIQHHVSAFLRFTGGGVEITGTAKSNNCP